ncbi:uncharacterized protein K02A2.6 [Aplysia californica]|uniref:Uncharacterized protein K02A2.6 n=1 Tax=Aplysia californica TaxID=6500 RepID=A0ABM1A535_APLCA|nr:uncharacterized protein K02A2.6 [Aplysia californica]
MPFSSYKMKEFATSWNFEIKTSSPRYPQSNGQSERFVNIVKTMFRKCTEEGSDPNLALLGYRNTPITGLPYSPAQLLMGRKLNDLVPTDPKMLKPQLPVDAPYLLQQRKIEQKKHYDRHTKSRPDHHVGDSVRVHTGRSNNWEKGVVTSMSQAPRSYYVTTEDGTTWRRNSRVINKSKHTPVINEPSSFDEDEHQSEQQPQGRQTNNQSTTSQVEFPNSQPRVELPCASYNNTTHYNRPAYTIRCGREVKMPKRYPE